MNGARVLPVSDEAAWRDTNYKERIRLISLYTRAWYHVMMNGQSPFELL